jgi:hypothetical protein
MTDRADQPNGADALEATIGRLNTAIGRMDELVDQLLRWLIKT